MHKETLKELLYFLEGEIEKLNGVLEDETLPKIERASLEGRLDGFMIMHSHCANKFVNA